MFLCAIWSNNAQEVKGQGFQMWSLGLDASGDEPDISESLCCRCVLAFFKTVVFWGIEIQPPLPTQKLLDIFERLVKIIH